MCLYDASHGTERLTAFIGCIVHRSIFVRHCLLFAVDWGCESSANRQSICAFDTS